MKELREIKEQLMLLTELVKVSCLSHKDSLTFEEGTIYTGRSDSNLYKLTSDRLIPHCKPQGKMITFSRVELDAWMLRNPVRTRDSIDAQAAAHVTLNRVKGW